MAIAAMSRFRPTLSAAAIQPPGSCRFLVWLLPCLLLSQAQIVDARPALMLAGARGQLVGTTIGAIHGTVTDGTGAVLRDVAVVISSDVLIGNGGTRSGSTAQDGSYRFAALPPGDYTAVFTRDGFTPVARGGIHVGFGLAARIDVVLALARMQQQVTVAAPASGLDATSTTIAVPFDAHVLANLPNSRSMPGILAATTAVQVDRFEVGGNRAHTGIGYKAYGTAGRNRPMVEGVNVGGIFATGLPLNYGSFEDVSVLTAAHGAEWDTVGVSTHFVVKSGGNHYHGTFYGDYENSDWQAFNISEEQARGIRVGSGPTARDTNRLSNYHDINADAGGYAKPDRIWWYFSFRDQKVAQWQVNFPIAPFQAHLRSYTGKGTFRLTENQRFVAFAHAGQHHQPYLLDPGIFYESANATAARRGRGWIWKGEWNKAIGKSVSAEVLAGVFGSRRGDTPNGTAPRFEDISTAIARGGALALHEDLQRDQLTGSLSIVRDGWLGSHNLAAGGRVFRTTLERSTRGYPGDVLHLLDGEAPIEVHLFQTPSADATGLWTYGAFVKDSWRVNRRITFDLGVRFNRFRAFLPEQSHPVGRFNPGVLHYAAVPNLIDWTVLVPRIGLVFDVRGDGTTLAKFSYGRYADPPGYNFGIDFNPNAGLWREVHTWADTNGSGVWEPGEEGEIIDRTGGTAIDTLDAGLKFPLINEATAWFERQLPANVIAHTGLVWRGELQSFASQDLNRPFEAFTSAVDVPDPGPDGRLGTGDDGGVVRVYEPGAEFVDLPFLTVVRNVSGPSTSYWTWEVAADKRFDGRWSISASFDRTWNHVSVITLTPNDLINAPGGQHRSTTWVAKLFGTYAAPWDVLISPYLRHQSGEPFARTFVAELEQVIVEVTAEPIGTRRMDNVTLLDGRVEKGFHLPRGRRGAVFVDAYNLLNANPAQARVQASGPAFLRPLNIVAPRIARVGVKLSW